MDVNRRLVSLEPNNAEWELEIGFAHNNLGKLAGALGRLEEAEAHYRSDLEIKVRIASAHANHTLYESFLGVSQYHLGQLLIVRGAYEEGGQVLTAARDHFRSLNELDGANLVWRVRRANIERELAKWHEYAGQSAQSAALLESSIGMLSELARSAASNTVWRRDLVRTLLVAADFAFRHGDTAQAQRQIQEARADIEELLAQEPTSLETRELSVYADLCGARLAAEPSGASGVDAALATIDRFFPSSADPWILELRAAALDRLDRSEESLQIRRHLEAIGYRGHGFRL